MELREVDPSLIVVDKMNERQGGTADEEFVDNVRATGIIQPPLVRPLDGRGLSETMGAEFSCVVGGRRVDAATQAELATIPVIVMPWDDDEALLASITENIDAFREDVDIEDRAVALERLMDLKDWEHKTEAAEGLGVDRTTIYQWLEPIHPDWQDTSIDLDVPAGTEEEAEERAKKVTPKKMQEARRLTGGGEVGEKVLELVRERGASHEDLREARKRMDTGQAETTIEAVEQVIEQREERQEAKTNGEIIVHTRTTFTGDYASAIKRAAEDRSASDDQIVRTAVSQWLEEEGYL